jgi:hypothetical protein
MLGVTFGLNWESAKKYCKDLTIGQRKDWRLPTIQELLSIVDYSKFDPALDSSALHSLAYHHEGHEEHEGL